MTLGKPPRLERVFQIYDPPIYFVTSCAAQRRKILATELVHRALINYGERGRNRGIALGRYVIMPDHIHLFVCGRDDFNLGIWVRGLKRVVAAAVAGSGEIDVARRDSAAVTAAATTGTVATTTASVPIWQRGFFDHIIRNSESYSAKWEYVRENPARAGLIASADDWPFQGEIALIEHR
jgi:REP-associated tyrosine transposase